MNRHTRTQIGRHIHTGLQKKKVFVSNHWHFDTFEYQCINKMSGISTLAHQKCFNVILKTGQNAISETCKRCVAQNKASPVCSKIFEAPDFVLVLNQKHLLIVLGFNFLWYQFFTFIPWWNLALCSLLSSRFSGNTIHEDTKTASSVTLWYTFRKLSQPKKPPKQNCWQPARMLLM